MPLSVLFVPLIAMVFTDEVVWTVGDFLIAGVLLAGAGGLYGFFSAKLSKSAYRYGLGSVILLCIVIIWVKIAVGLFFL